MGAWGHGSMGAWGHGRCLETEGKGGAREERNGDDELLKVDREPGSVGRCYEEWQCGLELG